jgi:4-hydroxybenzoate polyprenyltransferase
LVGEKYSCHLQAARHVEIYNDLISASRLSAISPKTLVREASACGSSDPGPAMGALQKTLTIHCLTNETRALQKRVQDGERLCISQTKHIESLQRELDARHEVIQNLQDHWQRAEETCEARLHAIEKLESHRQQLEARHTAEKIQSFHFGRSLCSFRAAKEYIRFDHWWSSKIPPLLTIAYLQILQLGLTPQRVAILLPALFFSIVCVAAYGHMINDIFDIESDRRAGKTNLAEKLTLWKRWLYCLILVCLGFLPVLMVNYSAWGCILLALNYLWPTIYSLPHIRMKEKGIAGVLCDAAGAHLTPTLFVLVVLSHQGVYSFLNLLVFSSVAVAWSIVLGVKGIINHQVADRENDIKSGTITLATQTSPGRLERFIPKYNLFVELPLSVCFTLLVYPICPIAVIALSIYCSIEILKYYLGFQFALNSDPRNTRASLPFANDMYYCFWFPMAVALQLAFAGAAWVWLPFLHLWVFRHIPLLQIRDFMAVINASCRHIGQHYTQIRSKHKLRKENNNGY